MILTLPWPPTVNSYYRSILQRGGRNLVLISEPGRRYRKVVKAAVLASRPKPFGDMDRLHVSIQAYPPDRRARDLDNLLKPLIDALMKAGVFPDDSQVDRIEISRQPVAKPGRVEVTLNLLP